MIRQHGRITTALLAAGGLVVAAACASSSIPARATTGNVLPGVEVLLRDSLHLLSGKRVGLITNHSGKDRSGTSTIDLLHRAPGVQLTALFGPEHGLRGAAEAGVHIASAVDSATGVPIYSLYGETRVPSPHMLENVDVLVYDIQDVGARVYTYEWTMVLAAEAATKAGKHFVVLDRPNPIRADRVEGGLLRPQFASFVGLHPVPMRYGLTPGELLRYLVGTGLVRANVTVVPMANYRRDMWWEETGIPWVRPSPNLRDMDATILYTGTVFFEGTNLSEGRGTDRPFRVVGAPWLTDVGAIARELNAQNLPGVRFDSTSRTIAEGMKHGGLTIPMIEVIVVDRNRVQPVRVGARMLQTIRARHPSEWQWRVGSIDRLSGSDELRTAVDAGTVDALLARWDQEARDFATRRQPYLIYR
ncbi:MAG: exo-beta-N-acetylmuramidase NamZ family protein [Gemmatimonadaceae bacterium]